MAIIFIILIAWKSGGAIGAVITGMICAALFVWALNNITDSGVEEAEGITDFVRRASALWRPAPQPA